MTEYRKKPVVVTATQWDGTLTDATRVIDTVLAGGGTIRYVHTSENHLLRYRDEYEVTPETEALGSDLRTLIAGVPAFLAVETLDATARVDSGGWVICGVQNEFYPCKPDIFADTYEEVTA